MAIAQFTITKDNLCQAVPAVGNSTPLMVRVMVAWTSSTTRQWLEQKAVNSEQCNERF